MFYNIFSLLQALFLIVIGSAIVSGVDVFLRPSNFAVGSEESGAQNQATRWMWVYDTRSEDG